MPIFMDRHNVSEAVTAEIVAQIHQEDLKIQQKFGCRGLTYWFDDARKTAFCLIDAPNEDAIFEMHKHAHGEIPHQIIEVDTTIVESFLGRIEDPEKAQNTKLNIINDPAFRTLIVITFNIPTYINLDLLSVDSKIQRTLEQFITMINTFDVKIVKHNKNGFLLSFKTVSKAIQCAQKIREKYHTLKAAKQFDFIDIRIGIHAGTPVTEKKSIFEDTIKLAEYMCTIASNEIVISSEVKQLYESENLNHAIDKKQIHVLSLYDENFIRDFMSCIDSAWQNPELKVADFEKNMGLSKSKLYREMMRITGKSPNLFLLHYRLLKSLQRLQNKKENVSEIAYITGFNSPSYFTKCFRKRYGIMPSAFA